MTEGDDAADPPAAAVAEAAAAVVGPADSFFMLDEDDTDEVRFPFGRLYGVDEESPGALGCGGGARFRNCKPGRSPDETGAGLSRRLADLLCAMNVYKKTQTALVF